MITNQDICNALIEHLIAELDALGYAVDCKRIKSSGIVLYYVAMTGEYKTLLYTLRIDNKSVILCCGLQAVCKQYLGDPQLTTELLRAITSNYMSKIASYLTDVSKAAANEIKCLAQQKGFGIFNPINGPVAQDDGILKSNITFVNESLIYTIETELHGTNVTLYTYGRQYMGSKALVSPILTQWLSRTIYLDYIKATGKTVPDSLTFKSITTRLQ